MTRALPPQSPSKDAKLGRNPFGPRHASAGPGPAEATASEPKPQVSGLKHLGAQVGARIYLAGLNAAIRVLGGTKGEKTGK